MFAAQLGGRKWGFIMKIFEITSGSLGTVEVFSLCKRHIAITVYGEYPYNELNVAHVCDTNAGELDYVKFFSCDPQERIPQEAIPLEYLPVLAALAEKYQWGWLDRLLDVTPQPKKSRDEILAVCEKARKKGVEKFLAWLRQE